MTPDEWMAEVRQAREKAKSYELTCFVVAGDAFVYDGGKRGYSGDKGWSLSVNGTSRRRATSVEIELWESLP